MKSFTAHTQQQGVTYVEHWYFAMGIAYRPFISVVAFVTHPLLPFIPIKPEHYLEATVVYLNERNNWIESAKRTPHSNASTDFLPTNQREIRV